MKKASMILSLTLAILLLFTSVSFAAVAKDNALSAYLAGEYTDEEICAYVEQVKAESDKTPTRILFRFHDRLGNEKTAEEVKEEVAYLTETYLVPLLGDSGKIIGQDQNPTYFGIYADEDEIFDIYLKLLLLCSGNTELNASPMGIDSKLPAEEKEPSYDQLWVRGDCNNDGKVNSLDYALLKRCVLQNTAKTMNYGIADLNSDCKINVLDYAILKQYVMGTIKELPPVQPWD